jgi:cold shock CspA family protein
MGSYTGIVKYWNPMRGFGFIVPLKKDKDVTKGQRIFIHKKDIEEEYQCLYDQQVVQYELFKDDNATENVYIAKKLRQIRSGSELFSVVWRGSKFSK